MTDRTALSLEFPRHFSKSEWPPGTLEQMNAEVIEELFSLRASSGVKMYPSKLREAHVRESGESRHSTQKGSRLSDATDTHVSSLGHLAVVYRHAQRQEAIGGIGLYFDTHTPMFHIDCRADRLLWIRVDGEYIYEPNDPARFYRVLGEQLEG